MESIIRKLTSLDQVADVFCDFASGMPETVENALESIKNLGPEEILKIEEETRLWLESVDPREISPEIIEKYATLGIIQILRTIEVADEI